MKTRQLDVSGTIGACDVDSGDILAIFLKNKNNEYITKQIIYIIQQQL